MLRMSQGVAKKLGTAAHTEKCHSASKPWQLHTHHYHRDYDSRELSTRASVGDGGGATGHQSSRAAVDKNKDQLDMLLGNLSKLRASQPVSAGESEEDDEYFGDEYEEGEEGVDWEWWRADGEDTIFSDASSSSGSGSGSSTRQTSPPEHEPQDSSQRQNWSAQRTSFAQVGSRAGQAGRGTRSRRTHGLRQGSRAGQGRGRGELGSGNKFSQEGGERVESHYGKDGARHPRRRSPAKVPRKVQEGP